MIVVMSSGLQKEFEKAWAYEMNLQPAEMFQEKEMQERFKIVKFLMSCKLKEAGLMYAHVQKMKSYIDQLEDLNVVFDKNLAMDLVVVSLPSSYDNFIMKYQLNSMDNTLMEVYSLYHKVEVGVKKPHSTPQTHVLSI